MREIDVRLHHAVEIFIKFQSLVRNEEGQEENTDAAGSRSRWDAWRKFGKNMVTLMPCMYFKIIFQFKFLVKYLANPSTYLHTQYLYRHVAQKFLWSPTASHRLRDITGGCQSDQCHSAVVDERNQ